MAEARPLRLLALHGYRQSARRLRQRTGALRKALRGRAELVAIDAPHRLPAGAEDDPDGDDPPRGWWFSGPGTFEAGEAAAAPAGLEESLSAVAAALAEHGPFDGLLGFSQGAALAAMVCALRARGDPRFPALPGGFRRAGGRVRQPRPGTRTLLPGPHRPAHAARRGRHGRRHRGASQLGAGPVLRGARCPHAPRRALHPRGRGAEESLPGILGTLLPPAGPGRAPRGWGGLRINKKGLR